MSVESVIGEIAPFLDKIFCYLEKDNISIIHLELDHLCYRVESHEQYEIKKNKLTEFAELLVEAPVNGRLISTFKLHSPLEYHNRIIKLIELPAPKPSSTQKQGLEHVEFVINESFNQFQNRHPHLSFNIQGTNKTFNPELEIEYKDCAVKFHHLNLEHVIQSEKELIPSIFVDVKKAIPKIIYEASYFTKNNFTTEKIEGYNTNICLLTEAACLALKNAAIELEKIGLGLKVFDAYRPVRAVKHFLSWAKKNNQMALFEQGFLAYQSSHSRGSTVDLTLYQLASGEELDMGTLFDDFSEKASTFNSTISEKQKMNRRILFQTMTKFGFRNYEKEWWHFTLIKEPYKNVYFDFPIKEFAT